MKIWLGFVFGFLTPLIAATLFLYGGGMPVATKGPPLPLERKIAKIALHAAMKNQDGEVSPIQPTEAHLMAGAKTYVVNCAVCHGVPGGKITAIAEGLFPKPPQLFLADETVTDDPPGKIYWKIKNGIRLTGMPGFVDHLNDTELWQMTLLLNTADKLPEAVQKALK